MHLSSPSELMIPRYSKLRDLLSLVKDVEVFEPSGWTSVAVSGNVLGGGTGDVRVHGTG